MSPILTAVHEDVELPGVGMEVAVHGHHTLLCIEVQRSPLYSPVCTESTKFSQTILFIAQRVTTLALYMQYRTQIKLVHGNNTFLKGTRTKRLMTEHLK